MKIKKNSVWKHTATGDVVTVIYAGPAYVKVIDDAGCATRTETRGYFEAHFVPYEV